MISHTWIAIFFGCLCFIQTVQFLNTKASNGLMFLVIRLPYLFYAIVSFSTCVGFAMNQWNIGG